MNILAFAGSNSSVSINKQLVTYAASEFAEGNEITILDLNDFEMPIYSYDREKESGVPALAFQFSEHISRADLILISLAEHNAAYSAAFKNIFDWVSRIPEVKVFQNKPIFLMATSNGNRGGGSVLKIAEDRFPRNGGQVIETFSLPKFDENFNAQEGIVSGLIRDQFLDKVEAIKTSMSLLD